MKVIYNCSNCNNDYDENTIKFRHIEEVEGVYLICPKCGYFEFRVKVVEKTARRS